MNSLEQIFRDAGDVHDFAKGYTKYMTKLLSELDTNVIALFAEQIEKAREEHRNIFIIGNGGSAVTASHMANDLGTDILKKSGSKIPFRAFALTDNTAVMLAVANDDGYENLFVNQLRVHYRPGDSLIAISASGNSPNVVEAAKWVKQRDGIVLSLVGFDGGKLKEISDAVVHIKTPKGDYGPVEDMHLVVNHLLAIWLQYKVKVEKNKG